MSGTDLKNFVKYIKDRAYDLVERQHKDLRVSVDFTTAGQTVRKVDNEDRTGVFQLEKMIRFEDPERVLVIFFVDGNPTEYTFSRTTGNDEKRSLPAKNDRYMFSGFGEAEIEGIINKRLEEERKIREIAELRKEIDRKNDEIKKLSGEQQEIQTRLNEKLDRITELENELEAKKTIRYFAGFAGDILESIGIKKSQLRQPLAGFLTEEQNDQKSLPEKKTTTTKDESGIVEETASQPSQSEKRLELINLIREYLNTTDDDTLVNIFTIFSEIEQDKMMSYQLVEHIEKSKNVNHGDI